MATVLSEVNLMISAQCVIVAVNMQTFFPWHDTKVSYRSTKSVMPCKIFLFSSTGQSNLHYIGPIGL